MKHIILFMGIFWLGTIFGVVMGYISKPYQRSLNPPAYITLPEEMQAVLPGDTLVTSTHDDVQEVGFYHKRNHLKRGERLIFVR